MDNANSTLGSNGTMRASPDVVSTLSALGYKACPRCRVIVEKADSDSCDHMTCAACSHEFCWSCLADRAAIYAHGNHFHRPSCQFYAEWSDAKPEFLPDKCKLCAHRGSACMPPKGISIDGT